MTKFPDSTDEGVPATRDEFPLAPRRARGRGGWRCVGCSRSGACRRVRQSGRAAGRRRQQQPRRSRRSGAAESGASVAIPGCGQSAGHGRRRLVAVLGLLQQCPQAHPERRLGPPDHTSRLPNFERRLRRQHAIGSGRHPRAALAPSGGMGLYDERPLPDHGAGHGRSCLCAGRGRGRSLVFSGRLPALAARDRTGGLRIPHRVR